MSSPTSSPPTSRTLRSLSSCHGGFEIPTCVLSDTLARFGSLRSGWSLIAPPFRVCLSCCSIRTPRASRLPTHIRSRPSLEKPMKEIRNFQLDFYAEISKRDGATLPRPSSSPYSLKCVERLSGKYSARVMVAYAVRHGEHHLPHGFVRRRMALHQSASARTHGTRTSQASQLKSDPRRRLLRPLKSGCPWRLLPKDFPPWKTVYDWFSGDGGSTGLGSG